MQIELVQTFKCIRPFTDKQRFIAYINGEFIVKTLKFIIFGKQAEELCNLVKIKWKNYDVYELDINLTQSIRKSSNTWFTCSNTKELFETISEDLKKSYITGDKNKESSDEEENTHKTFSPPFGIFNLLSIPKTFHFLDKESLTFLLFQLLNKIIIKMKYTLNDLNDMWSFCGEKYRNNARQKWNISNLKRKYRSEKAIEYYTKNTFLFRSLKEVLQHEDIDGIYEFRYYISDLHKQLKQRSISPNEEMILYRGKKLPFIVLQQLKEFYNSVDAKDKVISINGFLSTTKDKKIAQPFVGIDEKRDGYESVMFKMRINKAIVTTVPYAYIADISEFPQKVEVLFSMGSVWKLISMERSVNAVWTIELELSNVFDNRLVELCNELLAGELSDDYYLFLLAKILYELGKYTQAGEFYHHLLEKEELSNKFKCLIHFNFATMRSEQGQYTDAQKHLEEMSNLNKLETIAINETNSLPLRTIHAITKMPSQLIILNNLGVLHKQKGDYSKARNSFEKALEEQGSPIEKAMVHNNLGNLEIFSGNIEEAHEHLEKAVDLVGNSLWSKQFRKDLENVKQQRNKNKS